MEFSAGTGPQKLQLQCSIKSNTVQRQFDRLADPNLLTAVSDRRMLRRVMLLLNGVLTPERFTT
jgi:hypothetical protein